MMNQENLTKPQKIFDKFSVRPQETPTYRVDNERIERIMKGGFLFGFTASDLFILLAAFLTIVFLQLQPYAIPYLEGHTQRKSTIQVIKEPTTPIKSQPVATSSPQNQQEQTSTEGAVPNRKLDKNRTYCKSPRPQVCTQECLIGPPFICGSDGKTYCTVCQACSNPNVAWYVLQDEPCADIFPSL
jgi:hypothetical protein